MVRRRSGGHVVPKDAAQFWDGLDYHVHDASLIVMEMSCDNGHEWVRRFESPCPVEGCPWNSRERAPVE